VSSGAQGAQLGRLLRRLVDEGLVDADAAMDGRVSMTDLSRSNAVGLFHLDGRPLVVVKGAASLAGELDSIADEAAAYRWLGASAATARLAPSPIPHAARGEAIVTQPAVEAVSLHEALASTPAAAERLIAELGGVLGRIHGARVRTGDLAARRPWILDVPAGLVPAMYDGSVPARRLAEEIARRPGVAAAITRLNLSWTARTAIHGDVKFDNVLVTAEGVLLVDWELACLGEPAWDLAGIVDGLLLPLRVAGSGPVLDTALVTRLAEPAMAAHRAVAGPDLNPSSDELARAVVARLAQTSTQLAAMGHDQPDAAECAPLVLAAATELADELMDNGTQVVGCSQ
jgi:aminoglycoside phosphotransferase (APT) family kinase protein